MHSTTLPTLVGLTGRAGVGKDTLADHLVSQYGFVKYSLASPLKEALNAIYGFSPQQWEDREWKETVIPWIGKSPRQLAQTLGTEWGRECVSPDNWLNVAGQRIGKLIAAGNSVVIADVRFDNEATFLRAQGGVIVAILRNVGPVSGHASERGVTRQLLHAELFNTDDMLSLCVRGASVLEHLHVSRPTPSDDHFA